MKDRMLTHWQTSFFGVAMALLLWWQSIGFKIPETKQEWAYAIGEALLAVCGLWAKYPRIVVGKEDANAQR